VVGALASGINAVAGGGSLISFPTLTFGLHLPTNIANATNSVSLWPGSLGGAFGFHNVFERTKPYLRQLLLPTILGASGGAYLFTVTSQRLFDVVVPFLILLAAILLLLQPKVKALVTRGERVLSARVGWILQFLVAVYGGYFGAGMGIMMLAAFALYMDANIHEINAVKSWLGVVINLFASGVFVLKGGLIDWPIAGALGLGSIFGGFLSARHSQRIHPDTLRVIIAVYGVGMAAYYLYRVL